MYGKHNKHKKQSDKWIAFNVKLNLLEMLPSVFTYFALFWSKFDLSFTYFINVVNNNIILFQRK